MSLLRFRVAALAASLVLISIVTSGCAEENARGRRGANPTSYVAPRDRDR